ncbi:MAG: peptidylprolyl isomerase [Pseudomonadota bacterium]
MLNLSIASGQDPVTVELDTSEGKIVLELNTEKAPKTVENFVKYVKSGHYEGTVFHRVIADFMIQGGGLDKELKEKPTEDPVRNEAGNGLRNDKYTVAMARTADPHSATSQFFINTKSNAFLNREQAQDGYGYTVFGKVTEGTEVVDKINKVQTHPRPNPAFPAMLMRDVPVNPIVIKSVKVVEK